MGFSSHLLTIPMGVVMERSTCHLDSVGIISFSPPIIDLESTSFGQPGINNGEYSLCTLSTVDT